MSKIEQLIDEIEEFIDGCKPVPFSSSKIAVPKDELYELLTELRLKTPDEIKRYQKIIAQKNKIIDDAKAQAEQMVQETTDYCNALVDEHEIIAIGKGQRPDGDGVFRQYRGKDGLALRERLPERVQEIVVFLQRTEAFRRPPGFADAGVKIVAFYRDRRIPADVLRLV